MNPKFKPMLAVAAENLESLSYPVLASPKLDGIRAVVIDGVLVSRSLKPIPNAHVQKQFGRPELSGLDGELIFGDPCAPNCFRDTGSVVMSHDKTIDVRFFVFDDASYNLMQFESRLSRAADRIGPHCVLVDHVTINNIDELNQFEAECLAAGYEGVMLRDPAGQYKYGRSTLLEGSLLKLKRFCDSEAEILGFEEQMQNANTATVDLLGRTERSTAKTGMIPKGTLGALRVRDITSGVEFSIGSGLDTEMRATIWTRTEQFIGKLVKYKFFPTGSKDLPRFPVFLGFRDPLDT